ncbi:GTP cyclohydrolase FolE2 [Ornithinibacillus bavariensis]|uniref:GTP cyclohydrolase FolE2 n=1 Tax=Ornithinibacillus bavariensis TaxID=545502 RepID=A0A920C4Z7_9BACI|nr:GTP cyclohydrolase FolE2 [Ornithinibacillus bavariensis]GIO26261.1 GTP cyclohydrolase FolE2 [Ornithinibacillus bavariensis]
MNVKDNSQKILPNKIERLKLFGSVEPGPKHKPTEKDKMSDLQNLQKDFLFELDAVGITNVKYPVILKSKLKPYTQNSIGTFTFTSSIKQTSKGTNMSRFMEQLELYSKNGFIFELNTLKEFTKELAERLGQRDATVEINTTWFYERKGPSSQIAGLNHADINLIVSYHQDSGYKVSAGLSVFVTTLCPCSKEISEYSAHNQRGNVSIQVSLTEDFNEDEFDWKYALLEAAESNASSRLHPILKRPDEKMVTEGAYENPRFVEDMARLVAADLYELPYVKSFEVTCQNEESIHMHDAIATIRYTKE